MSGWLQLCCALVWCCMTFGQTSDPAAGARLYRLHCAECHGRGGEGGLGPDLTRGVYRRGSTDQAIFQTISSGIAGTPMPPATLSDEQLWQIVAHVRLLAGGVRVAVSGDPMAGEKLFTGKGGCLKCHMVNGKGGRLGPDLTLIGSQRSPGHLRSSIIRPDEDVGIGYWAVEAVDKGGKSYVGIRMNEDTYTIQILDMKEDLHSLSKEDLRSLTVDPKKSRMPPYEKTFTAAELDDLVSYLYSLERKGRRP
jgi:putative heme-binding domain-containing protein